MIKVLTYSAGLKDEPTVQIFIRSLKAHAPSAVIHTVGPDNHPDTIPHTGYGPGPGNAILGRWRPIGNFLRKECDPEEFVLLADLRDIVFNADPEPPLQAALRGRDIVFFSEHQTTGQHKWCVKQAQMFSRLYGHPHGLGELEVNGGVIYGKAKALAQLAEYLTVETRKHSTTPISDQPIINHYVRKNHLEVSTDKSLYCHGELVAAGRWPETPDPGTCVIFHQFERSPAWKGAYFTRYLRKDEWHFPELVVSHYNEKLNWMSRCFPGWPVTVYSKSPNPPEGTIALPNVGFEAHTWCHHFYENYDHLPKVSVCLQGNPFDHWKREDAKILKRLHNINVDDFSYLPICGLGHGSHQRRSGQPHHPAIGPDTEILWKELFGYPPPGLWFSFYGGQFAVHRDRVRSRPREWWFKARDMIQTKSQACAAERFWEQVFLR